jgi:hypothetical protein
LEHGREEEEEEEEEAAGKETGTEERKWSKGVMRDTFCKEKQ